MDHFFQYKIGTRTYVARTTNKALHDDVASKDGYLRNFLWGFFHIDPKSYAKDHAIRAHALLGGLHATSHKVSDSGKLIDFHTPKAIKFTPTKDLGTPVREEHGVTLWWIRPKH
ncbi:MAG: hypothetical protein O2960_26610 [Verrucomicrobia bacterium]|nr:hypothetical protein [Verrucomicrobiota bacterium]